MFRSIIRRATHPYLLTMCAPKRLGDALNKARKTAYFADVPEQAIPHMEGVIYASKALTTERLDQELLEDLSDYCTEHDRLPDPCTCIPSCESVRRSIFDVCIQIDRHTFVTMRDDAERCREKVEALVSAWGDDA